MKKISTIASLVRNTLSVSLNLSPFKTPAGLMERKLFSLAAVAALFLSASVFAAPDPQKPSVKFGFSPGPYEDLWEKAIKPAFEKKGYKTEKVVFQDWVQPNKALSNGDIDVNIFQHVIYLRKFIEDNGLKPLDEIIKIPTAGLGAYSNTAKSVKDLKKGDKVTLALDPTNLARSLRFLAAIKWITLKKESDPTKATLNDIGENPYGLDFVPTEAAQLPRTLGSAVVSIIPGNYAISAGLKLSGAIVLETLTEDIKNIVAVRVADINNQWVKDLKEVVESKDFKDAIEADANLRGFQKPEWYKKKWNIK